MFFVMLTITSRQMCFGSLRKTVWRKSKKFAARSLSWLRSGSGIKIQSIEFCSRVSEVLRGKKGLSMAMVQRLRARLHVLADLLLPPPKKSPPRRSRRGHFQLPFARWMLEFIRSRSFQIGQQLPRLADQCLSLPAFVHRFAGEESSLQGILIASWCARSDRAAMHATTLLAVNRR